MIARPSRPPVVEVVLVGVVVLGLLAWPLVSPPIWAHGEAREGLVVRDIIREGRWILPRRMGELPSKPPLFHWVAAGVAHVAGLSDATVRFPSALAASMMAGTTFIAGWLVGGRATAWLGVAALLGLLEFWRAASEARVDMVFAACIAIALTGFLAWYRATAAGRPAKGPRAVAYLATAAAVLTKGPAGAVLPALVIVGFLVASREARQLRRFWSWPLAGLVLLIDGGWYAFAIRNGGREFVALQLLHENLDRFVGEGGFHRTVTPWLLRHSAFRMEVELATEFFPWNLVLVGAALRWWHGEREGPAGRFLHAWWIVVLLFFSVAAGKRTVYLLPLAPAIALLAACALTRWLAGAAAGEARAGRRGVALGTVLAGAVVAVALANQGIRFYHQGRHSLAAFASEVERLVPPTCPLEATAGVPEGDRLVLAYRLGRDVGRVRSPASRGNLLLVPAARVDEMARDGFGLVAEDLRPRVGLALVRRPGRTRAGC